MIIEKVLLQEYMDGAKNPDRSRAYDRKALDRPIETVSKSLHLVPTATNAASTAHFMKQQRIPDPNWSDHFIEVNPAISH